MIEKLRALRDEIPHFTLPDSKNATRRLNPVASVPKAFIEMMLAVARTSRTLAASTGQSPEEIEDLKLFAEAYEAITGELRQMTGASAHTVALAHSRVATWALHTYAVAKRVARGPDGAELLQQLTRWRIALGRGRRPTPRAKLRTPGEETPPPEST